MLGGHNGFICLRKHLKAVTVRNRIKHPTVSCTSNHNFQIILLIMTAIVTIRANVNVWRNGHMSTRELVNGAHQRNIWTGTPAKVIHV